jgi:hypothetical protein
MLKRKCCDADEINYSFDVMTSSGLAKRTAFGVEGSKKEAGQYAAASAEG